MNDYLKSEKRKIRRKFLVLRDSIDPVLAKSYSVDIFSKIKEVFAYVHAKTVMFYLSFGSEVVTDLMVNSAVKNKKVVVPIIHNCNDSVMQAVKISKLEDAYCISYGVRQPEIKNNINNVVAKDDIDLVLVPGIVFDVLGYRIGYGKGFYDRWLRNVPINKIMGLAYDFQIIDKLPIEKYDMPVGTIITEKRIIQV
ncbi:MAG: 5-formyltetrahydrofolate cyclo-ligase [Endomicrobium sp.]|nr:5-formyltetrahydrofolate cyclo-ligase [Endomicrobium sp.]